MHGMENRAISVTAPPSARPRAPSRAPALVREPTRGDRTRRGRPKIPRAGLTENAAAAILLPDMNGAVAKW